MRLAPECEAEKFDDQRFTSSRASDHADHAGIEDEHLRIKESAGNRHALYSRVSGMYLCLLIVLHYAAVRVLEALSKRLYCQLTHLEIRVAATDPAQTVPA